MNINVKTSNLKWYNFYGILLTLTAPVCIGMIFLNWYNDYWTDFSVGFVVGLFIIVLSSICGLFWYSSEIDYEQKSMNSESGN